MNETTIPIFDAHLDLAWSAVFFNRDLKAEVANVRRREQGMTDEPARGRGPNGMPTRGMAGQLMFFTRSNPSPVAVDGDTAANREVFTWRMGEGPDGANNTERLNNSWYVPGRVVYDDYNGAVNSERRRDALFALVNLVRHLDADAEDALRQTARRFAREPAMRRPRRALPRQWTTAAAASVTRRTGSNVHDPARSEGATAWCASITASSRRRGRSSGRADNPRR